MSHGHLRRTPLLLLICAAWATGASAATDQLPRLDVLSKQKVAVSAMIYDLGANETIAAVQPDNRISPASVTKLYTTAAALERWGPSYRFRTRLVSDGEIEDGVLDGDLIFVGAGDPGLDSADLWSLITRLRQAGVQRIDGDLVVNDALFGRVVCLTRDRCEARNGSDSAYDAPLSAAGVNFSTLEVSILPAAEPGQPAEISLMPPGLSGFEIDGRIDTVAADRSPRYRVWRTSEMGRHIVHVRGRVPAGTGPHRAYRSIAYPSRYTGAVLSALLANAGIEVGGHTRIGSKPVGEDINEIAAIEGQSMGVLLQRMMAASNNFMADMLTLDLMAYEEDPGTITLSAAAQKLEAFARQVNRQIPEWNGRRDNANGELIIESGSGLSTSNRVSARDVVSLLTYIYHRTPSFPAFLGTLPVGLHSDSQRLGNGDTNWLTRIAAKTGALSEPVTVQTLAGYIRLEDGGWAAFAALVNGTDKRPQLRLDQSMDVIREDLERIMTRH